MKYIAYTLSFFGFACGLASAWAYFSFGRLTVAQTIANLMKFNTVSPVILLSFVLCVILPATILSFLPRKIRVILATISFFTFIFEFNIISYIQNKSVYNTLYEDNFVVVDTNNIIQPENKRNLIVIYVESLEKQYSDTKYSSEVLTPYLQSQKKHEVHFEDFVQLASTKYTLAGTISSMCGFLNQADIKDIGSLPNFYPNLPCIPDILASRGYKNIFMQSADLDFANTTFFLKQHNFNELLGSREWIKKFPQLAPQKGNSWGIRDSILYENAKKTLENLQTKQQPFALFMATIDTHGEQNFVDPICKMSSTLQNVILCSDYMLKNFIEWCKKQSFYKNTTIVIMGDHIAHGRNNSVYVQQPQNREIENIILNSVRTDKKEHKWTSFDMAPTILEAIGYNIPSMGLGRSLFGTEQTVLEKYGKKLDVLLEQKSRFLEKISHQANLDRFKNDRYFEFEFEKKYNSKADLEKFAGYSNLATFSVGKLWLTNLNLKASKYQDLTIKLKASALHTNKKRIFDILANKKEVGKIIFEKRQEKESNVSIFLPKEILQNSKIQLEFINNDVDHWSPISLGIGISELSIY